METMMKPEAQQLLNAALALPREQRRWVRNQAQQRACKEQGRHYVTEEEFLADMREALRYLDLSMQGKLKCQSAWDLLEEWKKEDANAV